MANIIWCKSCGEKCTTMDSYCPVCHASLKGQDHSDELPLDGYSIDMWYKFIGKNADKYVKGFVKHRHSKKYYIDFNPAAWFFPAYWFCYRRMFGKAVVLQLISILLAGITVVVAIKSKSVLGALGFAYLISYGLPMVVGLFANSIYRQHIKEKFRQPIPDMDAGGTSAGAIIGWYFLSNAMTNGIVMFMLLIGGFFANRI